MIFYLMFSRKNRGFYEMGVKNYKNGVFWWEEVSAFVHNTSHDFKKAWDL